MKSLSGKGSWWHLFGVCMFRITMSSWWITLLIDHCYLLSLVLVWCQSYQTLQKHDWFLFLFAWKSINIFVIFSPNGVSAFHGEVNWPEQQKCFCFLPFSAHLCLLGTWTHRHSEPSLSCAQIPEIRRLRSGCCSVFFYLPLWLSMALLWFVPSCGPVGGFFFLFSLDEDFYRASLVVIHSFCVSFHKELYCFLQQWPITLLGRAFWVGKDQNLKYIIPME